MTPWELVTCWKFGPFGFERWQHTQDGTVMRNLCLFGRYVWLP